MIQTLIGSGGIIGLFLITERKTAAALKNMQSMYDTLQSLYDKLQSRYDIETDKVGKLYDQIGKKNELIDTLNTRVAIGELKRCDCVNCDKRQPPIGDRWKVVGIDGLDETKTDLFDDEEDGDDEHE